MTSALNKLSRTNNVLFRLPLQVAGFVVQDFRLHSLDAGFKKFPIASLPVTSVVIDLA